MIHGHAEEFSIVLFYFLIPHFIYFYSFEDEFCFVTLFPLQIQKKYS